MRAHGFWDRRLDELGITPRGKPYEPSTRVLRLPASAFAAIAKLVPRLREGQARASPRRRGTAFRRLQALVHNLVTVAALLGRRPVIPAVPCEFVAAIQPTQGVPVSRSRFGVSHPSVVATGQAGKPTCHLSPGTWRPGGPDQCYHNWVMHDFDFDRFVKLPSVGDDLSGTLRVQRPPQEVELGNMPLGNHSIDIAGLRKLCREASPQASRAVLQLEGLLPLRDYLIDRPLSAEEFDGEAYRKSTRRPRWPSLLQQKELEHLAADCPGAAGLIAFRHTCVGYFIAGSMFKC